MINHVASSVKDSFYISERSLVCSITKCFCYIRSKYIFLLNILKVLELLVFCSENSETFLILEQRCKIMFDKKQNLFAYNVSQPPLVKFDKISAISTGILKVHRVPQKLQE